MPTEENSKKKERNSKGQFTKGHKKTGGRALGTKNRNGNVRDRLKEVVEPYIERIPELIEKAIKEDGASEALKCMEKFMPYFMPKYSALTLGADQDRPISEEQRLLELDAKYTKKELSINMKTFIVVDNDKPAGDADPDEDYSFDLSQLEKLTE